MADAKKDNAKKAAPKKGGKGKLGFLLAAILGGGSLLFIMPTFVMVAVGMVPTLVALLTDDDKEHSSAIAIGSLNFVGILPFVIDLWIKGQSIATTFAILTQGTTWLVILGAAAVGKLIIFVVPQVTASFTLINAEHRLKLLKENLNSLQAAWGPDVGTTKPLNSLRPNE